MKAVVFAAVAILWKSQIVILVLVLKDQSRIYNTRQNLLFYTNHL